MEKGKISTLQMALLLYPAILATAILAYPSSVAQYVGNHLWLPPILATSVGFITIFIAIKLHNLYPGKTVIQFSEDILGKILGKIISFLIILFYLQSTGVITRAYSEFIAIMTNLICLFVLGTTTALKLYPLMNVSRYVSFAGFFENLESVVMAIWIAGAFVKISVFFYVIVLGIAQWLNLSDYRPIIWPIGILVGHLAYWAIPNLMALNRFNTTIFPIYKMIMQILIPLMLLGIGLVKKKAMKS